ncbi:MAG: hypothetical protein A3G24_22605 [Betaproteobacteria bacterium RIFCSPLOWO2_12_FULL_62_13]|nr:MAG: hypothetical protein A3G24_22605 [Betaproteobacteria bacterium RIFCSPLOWO2_12_FULL_62_13]
MGTASLELRPYNPEVEVQEEDGARADVYALLAHLFYSPPSEAFLRQVAGADAANGNASQSRLATAWHAFQQAARDAAPAEIRQEYDDTFISVGRPPVLLYGSFYGGGFLMDKHLVGLRDEFARLGLARKRESGEPEDHISALCDVMRFLIVGDADMPPAGLEVQHDFFRRHIKPWYAQLCEAITKAEQPRFYKQVAMLAKEFFDLEAESFEIA